MVTKTTKAAAKVALNGSEWVGAADAARIGKIHQKQLTQHAKHDHFQRIADPTTGRWKYNLADLEAYAARDRTLSRKRKYVRPSRLAAAAKQSAVREAAPAAPRKSKNGHGNGGVAVTAAPVPPATASKSRAAFFEWIDAGIQADWLGGDEALQVIKRQLPTAAPNTSG
jgi:hypothetical protein